MNELLSWGGEPQQDSSKNDCSALSTASIRDERKERRQFLSWLTCWVALPNLPFIPITVLGGPARYPEIVICAASGMAARHAPYWVRLPLYVTILAALIATFIAHMFNLHISFLLTVILMLVDIRPAVSPEYVTGAALIAVSLGAGVRLLRRNSGFFSRKWVLSAFAVIIGVAAADYALSRNTMGSYKRLAPAGAPFSSATNQTRLLSLADGKANILVVIVEAMGEPRDRASRDRLYAIWMRPELAARYDMARGRTPFYGSTTSGEMRELCQRWGDYLELTQVDPGCIPAVVKERGYETTSFHAFTHEFFERDRWYPLIGLDRSLFAKELLARGASFCPGVFYGACDRDIPNMIGRQLEKAKKPQFIYWLTLNSHYPVIENKQLGTENCKQLGLKLDADFPMICRQFALWEDTANALAQVLSRRDLPPTHVLIVGDHMPPFTHQRSRLQFDGEHVPWILLKHRGSPAAKSQSSGLAAQ